MTSDLRAAAQQALEALEFLSLDFFMLDPISPGREAGNKAITALRAALAEPSKEYERGVIDGMQRQAQSSVDKAVNRMAALATVPSDCPPDSHQPQEPQRKPLTEKQIWEAVNHDFVAGVGFFARAVAITRAIERAHGIT